MEHNFRLHIPVGNFGVPLKTFCLFRKFSGRANQNSLSIYIPTEISGFFGKWQNTLHRSQRDSNAPVHYAPCPQGLLGFQYGGGVGGGHIESSSKQTVYDLLPVYVGSTE